MKFEDCPKHIFVHREVVSEGLCWVECDICGYPLKCDGRCLLDEEASGGEVESVVYEKEDINNIISYIERSGFGVKKKISGEREMALFENLLVNDDEFTEREDIMQAEINNM